MVDACIFLYTNRLCMNVITHAQYWIVFSFWGVLVTVGVRIIVGSSTSCFVAPESVGGLQWLVRTRQFGHDITVLK